MTVSKVYGAIAKVVAELDIEKDGVLPGNMSGAAYRTAEAVTSAVRTLFGKHNLILIPNETVVAQSSQEHKNRMVYSMVIRGEYTIVSLEDGSQVSISGTGRGQATGTAVDANVASTFAFKNALQKLFLISDNRDEQAGMNDGTPGPTKIERQATLAREKVTSANSKASEKVSPEREAQARIRDEFIKDGVIDRQSANDEVNRLRAEGDKKPFQTLVAALEKGELPDA